MPQDEKPDRKVYELTEAGEEALRQGKLEEYRRIEEEHFTDEGLETLPPVHRLAYMMLRLGIRGEEAWLEWAEELDGVLERMEG